MIRQLTCIGCPMGCELTVEVEEGRAVSVSGNTCGVGKRYAETEISAPVRMVTSTIEGVFADGERVRVPVKTSQAVPKDRIFAVMEEIRKTRAMCPVQIGDVLIPSVAGTCADVIVTKNS